VPKRRAVQEAVELLELEIDPEVLDVAPRTIVEVVDWEVVDWEVVDWEVVDWEVVVGGRVVVGAVAAVAVGAAGVGGIAVVVGIAAGVAGVAVAVAVVVVAAAAVAVAVAMGAAVVAADVVVEAVGDGDVAHLALEVALGCFAVAGGELRAPASGPKAAGEARHFDSDFDLGGSWVAVAEMGVEGFGIVREGSEAAASDAAEDFVLARGVQGPRLPVPKALEVAASGGQSPPGGSVQLDLEAEFD
jgi:hypothetical protein